MKSLFKKSLLFVLLLLLLGWFFLQPLTIYPVPQTAYFSFSTLTKAESFAPDDTTKVTCYQPLAKTATVINQDHLRILVWNLHKGFDQGWQQALTRYSQDRDLLLLQEVTSEQNLPKILSDLPQQLFASPVAYKDITAGVALLTKFVPQRYCSASVVEPWIRLPKSSISASYALANGQSLLVISAHLINFEWIPEAYQQQLQQLIQQVKAHQGPVILAGDFNAWNAERTTLIRDMAQQLGLSEVKFTPDVRERFNQYPLDHLFVRDMEVIEATTEQSKASDHNPLLVELSF
ncbi:hypothetical protein QV08_04885 [Gallibacterium salpingitidis]|uniref:Endonuclease/exonuclease/phosphatase domain-containing protein n=1 Tax=Gallibacterium salpingitidis TaxID=505341 RepID=A0A1A7NZ37_9PAST|nr:hypothetical protein QS62_03605 [Gallibacterium salpingitidis]OBX08541.1 hypothetical protein QV08_04885 [Gallibacterium salpingitidis]OBX11603.1 hypothetical protein QV09_01720 [Gallibacterium salpingitidis]